MAKRKLEEDCLSCSLCLEIFSEPKTLPCLHRFCETCLNKYITSSTMQWTGITPSFLCPCCRENILAPNPKRPRSEWASLFKTDFLIKEIIGGSQEKPETKNACRTHVDIEYDCYCFDCSAILCHKCAIESHRQCGRVEMLTNTARDRKAALNVAIQNMRALIEESTKWERHCNMQKDAVERESNDVSVEIQAWGKQLRQQIKQKETKLLSQLAEKCSRRADTVNSAVVKIQNMKKQFQSRLDTAASKLSLPNVELIVDNSVLDITRECQQVSPTKAVDHMKQICNNMFDVTFSFQKISSPAVLGSIVESRNDNSIVTSGALSQVSDRKREMSTSSVFLPTMTSDAISQVSDRKREKSTSYRFLPTMTSDKISLGSNRKHEQSTSSGFLPTMTSDKISLGSDGKREKSTRYGFLPTMTSDKISLGSDGKREQSTSSAILPAMAQSKDAKALSDVLLQLLRRHETARKNNTDSAS